MTDNTTPKHPRNQVTRRDFLTTMGTALGGVALTMHGGGAASPALGVSQGRLGAGAIPNGYNFYRVFTANTGATLPFYQGGTNPVLDITPAVFMGTDPSLVGIFYIYFHGRQTSQANAAEPDTLFLLNMDYTKTPPAPSFLLTLVAQGQSLGSGLITGVPIGQLPLVVSRIGTGDSNSFGHYATTLSARDTNATVSLKSAPGVYLYDAFSGVWNKTARFGDAAPDGSNYGGIFGDVAIDDNDNVTFIAATTQGGSGSLGAKPRKGGPPEVVAPGGVHKLIHLPRHKRHGGQVLLRSGDLIPGTTAIIRSFGFVDVASYGQFVVQIGATPATGIGSARIVGSGGFGRYVPGATDRGKRLCGLCQSHDFPRSSADPGRGWCRRLQSAANYWRSLIATGRFAPQAGRARGAGGRTHIPDGPEWRHYLHDRATQ